MGIMDIDICNIYRSLCSKNKVSVDQFIVSCLYNASVHGELNLKSTTITENSCSLIVESIKCKPTIKVLNLSYCLLPPGSLKNFLDLVNKLINLKKLYLKGNQIGNKLTLYISKILLNNTNITELQLDWNNIGDSEYTFSQLCCSLMSNTALNTLNLAHNNLCQTCGGHLAKLLTVNKCLKIIDLSWNFIGETGADLLLKSLKNNEILIELNIQGNSVSVEMSTMIAKKLKQNESINFINQNEVQPRNLSLIEHNIGSVDKNYQAQLNILDNQYHNSVDELQSKLQLLQSENQELKQEIVELKNNSLKEQEKYIQISNQMKKIKSEVSFNKQSLNSLIQKISNEVPNSDMENMSSLEGLDKVFHIVKEIKKNYNIKISHEKKEHQRLLEAFPKLTNELNVLKGEWKNLKSSTKLNFKNYSDELIAIKELLLTNMFHFKISNHINHKIINLNNLIEQEIIISDKQTKMLILSNIKIKTLYKEKTDLEIRLAETETHSTEAAQTVRVLQNNLKLAENEINLGKTQLNSISIQAINTQLNSDKLTNEIHALKNNLIEKDHELQLCKMKIDEINNNHKNELLNLEKKFQAECQTFKEKRNEDQKQIEEMYNMFKKHFDKLKGDD